ncbi:hypothetical protein [Cupriavidus pauculus]|uniref:DUF1269 domain-containing protein n=1 Tax=Cupriavidus pauculus TaxID=82633 RepID=A0A2N5CDP6_9BURK|nr:hypothetical protein [Cupriavidus pauculus]PLQ00336.1 hypothetical protein CYJ10_11905 [Cupriavidus pauculus]
MRTLLYFTLNDVATARLTLSRLDNLFDESDLREGPWFSQRDNYPVEGLPKTEIGQTTYRERTAIGGFIFGALAVVIVMVAYGEFHGPVASAVATLGGIMLGGMMGWWIGGMLGVRVQRRRLTARRLPVLPGQILMIANCEAKSRDLLMRTVHDLGGVRVDERSEVFSSLGWVSAPL